MDAHEQQQERADMDAAFAAAMGQQPPAAPASEEPVDTTHEAETPAADLEPTTPATDDASPPADAPPAAQEDDDPVLLDGLKRSELYRLLSNAAQVDGLKRQLDKAHGSIGDLNRRLQQRQEQPAQPPAPELSPELAQFEQDYPEIAQYLRHMTRPAPVATSTAQQQPIDPQAEQHAPAAVQPPAGVDPLAVELAVMDHVHSGWRQKIASQDFSLWLAAQGEPAQAQFAGAQTAKDMAAMLGQFDQWSQARAAAAQQTARGRSRLRAAVTPTGGAQRPQAAPTEEDEMRAAFNAVMGR